MIKGFKGGKVPDVLPCLSLKEVADALSEQVAQEIKEFLESNEVKEEF